jgi:PAS domain S-box-containing protein
METTKAKRQKSLGNLQHLLFRPFSPSKTAPPGIIHDRLNPYTFANAIIEAIHYPIVVLDKSLTITSANKAFYKTFKLTKKQLLGNSLPAIGNRNTQINELTKRLEALTMQNTSFEEFELTYDFAGIGTRTLLINAKRILLGKYATDFILLGIEDITKRRIVDQQKDDFIGYVTHELKTPITTITAFIQILQGYHAKTQDKKSQFLLSKVSKQMERLTGLLNSFANVYKVQSGKLELHKSKMDLDKLVHEIVEAFQYTTTTHELIIKGSITKPVFADKNRIHEILINLIVNAIKYSPNADKVIIKLSEKDNEVTVSVKDYGFGISKEEQKKVFERFFRVKGKTENKIEGLGLGLFLVSEIIKQHKGKIWVKSNFGEGSTFSFSLPTK